MFYLIMVGLSIRKSNCTKGTKFSEMRENPKVSVILTLYTVDQMDYLRECVNGLLKQTYDNIEIVVCPENDDVIAQTVSFCEALESDIDISVFPLHNVTGGLSEARNRGARKASGEIVAFLDVDAVPNQSWVEELVNPYVEFDLFAVGGRATPVWETTNQRPLWIPEEFDWLIGSNHTEFGEEGDFVRNTYGCNISFRRDVFLNLGGYDTELGKNDGFNLQGEEPELGIKLQTEYNTAVYYQPNAVINHYVNEEQQELGWLVRRAFLQGISKQVIESKHSGKNSLSEENSYLSFVLFTSIPNYFVKAVTKFSLRQFIFGIMIFLYVVCVGLGYFYVKLKNY